MNFKDLKKPFPPKDIEWRIQQGGVKNNKPWAMILAYVTNRAIMERLDAVCGPENWTNLYEQGPDGGILCGIGIKTGEDWVYKWDGAENTHVEAVKGGLSSAMKRAAVQWGIGRYLYNLEAAWAVFVSGKGRYKTKVGKEGGYYDWNPPELPQWALPEGTKNPPQKKPPAPKKKPEASGKSTFGEEVDKLKSSVDEKWFRGLIAVYGVQDVKEITDREIQKQFYKDLESEVNKQNG